MTPRVGNYFVEWPSASDDRTLGFVDFSIFPHLDAYAIDEQTAIKVVDGCVEVVAEGQWTKFGS